MAGLMALAVAMGIGRFAFTPVLPMMQRDAGLSLAQGGWLASANYVGYLAGAVAAARSRLRPDVAITGMLALIALSTLGAAATTRVDALIVLRFIPGFASALVLVYVSAWALQASSAVGRPQLGGAVFSGVGVGIAVAGLVCLALVAGNASSRAAWTGLGAIAAIATACVAPVVRGSGMPAGVVEPPPRSVSLAAHWRLVFAHAAFGFGYIVPATFLPVMAREALGASTLFGWAWPIFGAAAAISTWAITWLRGGMPVRHAWAASLVVMALGVAAPAMVPGLAGIVTAALAVGATFMVATMLAMQEARREMGEAARPLMAAMTTAFAAGQIAGPLVAGAAIARGSGFGAVLLVASAPLLVASWLLWRMPRSAGAE